MIFVVILLASELMIECQGYIHINSMTLYEQPVFKNDSLFGYSIAYQPGKQRLVITAPQEDDVGKVYTTGLNPSNIIKLPVPKNLLPRKSVKHDFWLGATVKANSKFFITCAPRYVEEKNNKPTRFKDFLRLPATLGVCLKNKYVNTDTYETRKLETISVTDRSRNTKNFGQQMDSFGWSMDITESDQLLIGSPAVMTESLFFDRKLVNSHRLLTSSSCGLSLRNIHVDPGRVMVYKDIFSIPRLLLNNKLISNKNIYNFGYSVTSGRFFNLNVVYIISTTFGNGKVFFFDSKDHILEVIENQEVGSMFGAALCAAKLGVSVLLVGAPTYSDNAYKHDVGAVYVYVEQTKNMNFKRIIKGHSSGSYFGHAIAKLGDTDGDKKDEIVIAAPFENGNGAVYVYSGASILDEKTPPIRIQPENFRSFGFSLAILEDTDGNGSNELAIGSPLDNKVVVFKTFASIKVILSAELNPKDKDSVQDYVLKYCIESHLRQENITADLVIVVELRNAKFTKFPLNDGVLRSNFTLLYNQNKSCQELDLHVLVQTDESYTSANKLLMSYNITALLKEDPQKMTKFDPSRVLLSETQSVLTVQGQKWNPDNSIDEPNLSLNITSSMTQPYMIGSSNLESFTLSVVNTGGAVTKSCMEVSVEGAHVVAYPRSCAQAADGLVCRYNQIIKTDSVWENVFKVDTNDLTSINKSLRIRCDLYAQCGSGNKTSYNNVIALKPYNDMVEIKGQSNPDRIVNMTMKDLQTGKSLEHVYTIYNYGLTNWVGVKSEMILENSSYIDYSTTPIKVYTDTSSTVCEIVTSSKDDMIRVECEIGNMKRQEKVIVVIAIAIVPESLEFESKEQNVTITTSLNLWLQDELKYYSLSTTLTFATAEVPLWVILAASFVGIFLMIILSYVLYEYGFLRRKTKDKLIEKKEEIHRQSMRRSMICANLREEMNRERNRSNEFQKQEDEDSV